MAQLVFAAHRDNRDEAGEERDGGDHGRADGDALGLGLGGVAHGIEVGKDLPGPLVVLFAHLSLVVAHFANSVGVVGYGSEHVHRDRIAGQREHADAGHGHTVGDEHGGRTPINEHREHYCGGDHQQRRHRALIPHRKSLDDVRGVARLAGAGQRLHRGMAGVRVVTGHLVQRHGQEHADQAGQRRPHVQSGEAKVRPEGQVARAIPWGKPAAAIG